MSGSLWNRRDGTKLAGSAKKHVGDMETQEPAEFAGDRNDLSGLPIENEVRALQDLPVHDSAGRTRADIRATLMRKGLHNLFDADQVFDSLVIGERHLKPDLFENQDPRTEPIEASQEPADAHPPDSDKPSQTRC
jgi:hypothetical protein